MNFDPHGCGQDGIQTHIYVLGGHCFIRLNYKTKSPYFRKQDETQINHKCYKQSNSVPLNGIQPISTPESNGRGLCETDI